METMNDDDILPRPIFIAGLMRSGTSLLRAMLGQHSTIASGLETHWFDIDWQAGTARHGEPLRDYLHRLGAFFELPADTVDALAERSDSAERFLDLFMSRHARLQGKSRWAEKTTSNLLHLERIAAHWPDARILHIMRDPRDVFASFRRSGKYGGPADYGALWVRYLGAAETFRSAGAAGGRMLDLRYEDLAAEPVETMRQVQDFIDAPFEEAATRFEGRDDEFTRVKTLTGHASTTLEQLARPLRNDRVGTWRDELSEAEVAAARAVVAEAGLAARFDALLVGAA